MKIHKNVWLAGILLAAFVGGLGGLTAWAVEERGKPTEFTSRCIAGQTRVIESNKTSQFEVMWDEACPQ